MMNKIKIIKYKKGKGGKPFPFTASQLNLHLIKIASNIQLFQQPKDVNHLVKQRHHDG